MKNKLKNSFLIATNRKYDTHAKLVIDQLESYGALATSEHGTALSVIRPAHSQGKKIKVYADETRPVLQGVRLMAWELMKDDIEVL